MAVEGVQLFKNPDFVKGGGHSLRNLKVGCYDSKGNLIAVYPNVKITVSHIMRANQDRFSQSYISTKLYRILKKEEPKEFFNYYWKYQND
jgi:hypothetical protein